jgi:amidophosphoribosyltransferase
MCGVIGIYDNEEVIEKMYNGLLTLQHRGQDAAGILTYDNKFHLKKGKGLVRDIFLPSNLARLKGNIGIGHTRYPTVGGGPVEDAQPFWINAPFGIAGAHNGNVSNFLPLKRELFTKFRTIINSNCDVEVILNVFAEYLFGLKKLNLKPEDIFDAVKYVYKKVKGAYSVVLYIAGQGMVGFRDPHGLRPLLFGIRKDKLIPSFAFASESVALNAMEYTEISDVGPGSAIFIDKDRKVHTRTLSSKPFNPCIFEYVYFARPDTDMNGINVYRSRVELGKQLADKIRGLDLEIDVVVPVPDSSRTAAIEIARILEIKYREGLVKNRYIGRTFIMPGNRERKKTIRHKLNPIASVFKDKKVLLVDDSIVRGNTSRSIIQMVRNAGARKIYFASYSSPLTNPCVYGIDMQTKGEFIAADSTAEQIARKINADMVVYQDLKAMEEAVGSQNKKIKNFCKACFTGIYPTRDVSKSILKEIANERDTSKQGCSPFPEDN